MRKMSKDEIALEAKKISDLWLGRYSLKNAIKISQLVRQRLWTEKKRRKSL